MANPAIRLVLLADAAAYVQSGDLAAVGRALDWATAVIERETGTAWIRRTEVRTYNAPTQRGAEAGRILDLDSYVDSVESVFVGDVEVTDFKLIKDRGHLIRWRGWLTPWQGFFFPWEGSGMSGMLGVQNIVVTATYGLYGDGESLDDVPSELTQACLDLVKWRVSGGGGGSSDLTSERIGEYSYTRRAASESAIPGLPQSVASVLVSLRRWN